jgi:radical SAM protein with 4Fe4S-binding SPASM domain
MRFQSIQLETIQGCTRKCWHCPNASIEYTGALMARELFDDIIEQLAAMEYRGSVRPYLMNEPFLDPRMPELMRHIQVRLPKCLCVVNTNADRLSLKLARELSDLGVKLRISAYDKATLDRFNWSGITTLHMTDFTRVSEALPDFYNNRAGSVELPGREPVSGDCQYPSIQMYVRHDGRVVLCCNDYHGQVVMGDATKEPLLAIFNNERFREYRSALRAGKRLPPLCDKCSYRGHDE